MKIYVIRHGLTELNKKRVVNAQIDEPLAKEGIVHAKNAANLIPKNIKYIYSSSLKRARQTAEIIGSNLKLPYKAEEELSEIDMGSLAGKSWEQMESGLELKKKHRTMQFNYHPFGGESIDDFRKRLITFLRKINKFNDYEVLVITHGGVIRLLHLLETGKPLVDEIEHVSLQTFNLNKILKNAS